MIAYTNNTAKGVGAEIVVRHVVTAAEETAEVATVPLGEAFASAPDWYNITIVNSAGKIQAVDATISFSGTNLIVTEEATTPTYVMAANDEIFVHAVKSAS